MRAKWYIRVWLIFHTLRTETKVYTKPGQSLKATMSFKECCGKEFIYSYEEELYHTKGKVARRARRANR